jgi:predicted transcriptional regulator
MTGSPMDVNAVGDLVLADPKSMRAIADPFRLALLDRLRRGGPATDAELTERMKGLGGDIAGSLDTLEPLGFVTSEEDVDGKKRWTAVGKGLFFEVPDDAEGEAAARELTNVMLLASVDLPRDWVAADAPRLPVDWVRASGLFNARVTMTSDELRDLQESLEALLEPFITREPTELPVDAAPVRVLAYFLPEGPAPNG